MATATRDRRINKKQFALAAGLVLVLLVLFVCWVLWPGPSIDVLPRTTFVIEPLGPSGLPDYERFLLESGGEHIPLEDNAAVLLWQACWPAVLSKEEADLMRSALGGMEAPLIDQVLTPVYNPATEEAMADWLLSIGALRGKKVAGAEYKAADRLIQLSMSRPWKRQQIPLLASWVDKNAEAIDLLVLGSQRPKLFSPSPDWLDDEYDTIVGASLPLTQSTRSAVRGLCIRAMMHLGEGQAEKALIDARACLRLASLTRQGFCFVQQMVAVAAYDNAFRVLAAILHQGEFSQDTLMSVREEIVSSPPFYESQRILDHGERISYLDTLIAVKSGKNDSPLRDIGMFIARKADWNVAMREGNRMFDKFATVASRPTRKQRLLGVAELYKELDDLDAAFQSRIFNGRLLFDSQYCGRAMSNIFLSLMVPAIDVIFDAEDKQATCRQLALTAVDLAIYRAKQSSYPITLEQLSSELPIDCFSDEPLIYQRTSDGGYLLYSVFKNEVDDAGDDYGGEIVDGEWDNGRLDEEQTDIVLRLPVPAFELSQLIDGE